jgi:hypothetical protein
MLMLLLDGRISSKRVNWLAPSPLYSSRNERLLIPFYRQATAQAERNSAGRQATAQAERRRCSTASEDQLVRNPAVCHSIIVLVTEGRLTNG